MKNLLKKQSVFWGIVKVCLVFFALFTYAMFQGGFVSWFLFYSFLPLGIYSLLFALYPLRKISMDKHIEKPYFMSGETMKVKIKIKRRIPFPLFLLLIEDYVPLSITEHTNNLSNKVIIPFLKREFSFEYKIPNLPRGEYIFDGLLMKSGDFLGFIEKQVTLENRIKILVFPKHFNMNAFSFSSQGKEGNVPTRAVHGTHSTMAVAVRSYQPGDKFSWIDWKATARKNEIMTKEFEYQRSDQFMLLIDPSYHSRDFNDFERMVTFAASLIKSTLRHGTKVGLISKGGKTSVFLADTGEYQEKRLNYFLAKLKVDNSDWVYHEFEHALQTNCVLLSAHLSDKTVDFVKKVVSKKPNTTFFLFASNPLSKEQEYFLGQIQGLAKSVEIIDRVLEQQALKKGTF